MIGRMEKRKRFTTAHWNFAWVVFVVVVSSVVRFLIIFLCVVFPPSLSFFPSFLRVCVKAFFFVAMILDWLAMGLMMIVLSMRRWRFAARGKAS